MPATLSLTLPTPARSCGLLAGRIRLMASPAAVPSRHATSPSSSLPLMTHAIATSELPRDIALVRRAAEGDERALGELYDRFGAVLYAIAYRIVGEKADAEEVVMEAFAQAWREAPRFDAARGSVAAWLSMMGRSRALDLVRARQRRARITDTAAAKEPEGAPAMSSGFRAPGSALDDDERRRAVSQALAGLSSPQRTAIELAYYDGLSQTEIAERLKEPLGTIKTRMRLGMQKLREALRPYYFEGAV